MRLVNSMAFVQAGSWTFQAGYYVDLADVPTVTPLCQPVKTKENLVADCADKIYSLYSTVDKAAQQSAMPPVSIFANFLLQVTVCLQFSLLVRN